MLYLFRENNYLIFVCAIADCQWTIQRNILFLLCWPSNFAFHKNNAWLLSTVRLNKSSFLLTLSGILTCQRQPSFIFWNLQRLVDSWVFLNLICQWISSSLTLFCNDYCHHNWPAFVVLALSTSTVCQLLLTIFAPWKPWWLAEFASAITGIVSWVHVQCWILDAITSLFLENNLQLLYTIYHVINNAFMALQELVGSLHR